MPTPLPHGRATMNQNEILSARQVARISASVAGHPRLSDAL